MKNNKTELSIKSKLLFNSLDMHYKIILNLDLLDTKRIKSIDTIFSTYRLTIKPFIDDESKEYQDKVYDAITREYEELKRMVFERVTVETLVFHLSPVLEHLKDAVKTCKINMDKFNCLWKIDKI